MKKNEKKKKNVEWTACHLVPIFLFLLLQNTENKTLKKMETPG